MPSFWVDVSVLFSDLTPYDRAVIEPSLHYLFDTSNCDKKIENAMKHGLAFEEAEREIKSLCSSRRLYGENEEFEYWVCPCRIFDPSVSYLVSCAMSMRNGILPYEGGYMDQPAGLMSAMTIVGNFLAEHEEKERKKQQAKSRQKGRR
jgi:hypothetical protein